MDAMSASPNTGLIVTWQGSLAQMSPLSDFRTAARDALMYAAGLGFLMLAKAKHTLRGYSSPKPFPLAETERSIAYDIKVVDEWLLYLAQYAGESLTLSGKNVLELGPGSDLGVGLYLLAKGAAAYYACDVHDLTNAAPDRFYAALIERVVAIHAECDAGFLKSQLDSARTSYKDPNNIYRYPDWIYRIFWFRGIPNRVRPYQYKQAFERHGWENVAIIPIERTTTQHPGAVYLDNQFRAEKNEMNHLSIVLCARKAKAGAASASRSAST
jgi:hypothetical protein